MRGIDEVASWARTHLPGPVVTGIRTVITPVKAICRLIIGFRRRCMYRKQLNRLFRTGTRAFWDTLGENDAVAFGLHVSMEPVKGLHVLFVMEHWADGNPECGETNSCHNLLNTYSVSGVGRYSRFHYDDCARVYPGRVDDILLATAFDLKPDVIVFTALPVFRENPTVDVMAVLRESLGTRIVSIWFDSVQPYIRFLANCYAPVMDVQVLLDSDMARETAPRLSELYLPMWTPQDPALYFNHHGERDIGVAFLGSVAAYPDRQLMLAALRENGVDVYEHGGQRERRLSPEEYGALLRRARMVVNFCCAAKNGPPQFKGRVMEALFSGALLLEEENDQTAKWLVSGEDYITFKDAEDLVTKARYYESHPEDAKRIAASGERKALQRYNAEAFWNTVFSHAGVPGIGDSMSGEKA